MISVIIPCYNEEDTIVKVLSALLGQDIPSSAFEVIIADGRSTDATMDRIASFHSEHPEINLRIVENPERTIPSGLNTAIGASAGDTIVRLDAHSIPYPNYLRRCVEVLEETGAGNVGGIWEIKPRVDTWIARSIAKAASHPLGAGDARYRVGGQAGPVDTVPFGAFPRKWIDRIGPFNEKMLTNEDYEYNTRIRQANGLIWFDPSIRSTYFARSTFLELARQYWRYGYWKARMLAKFPGSLRWRQLLPPLFIFVTLSLGFAGFFWRPSLLILGVQWAVYGLFLFLTGAASGLKVGSPGMAAGLPLAILIMHLSWGTGFLVSLMKQALGDWDE
jgi:succinoglycan biosynthesis protein ExoA